MPSTFVSPKFALLAANGTTTGIADITDNTGWIPGCTVFLIAASVDPVECVIVEQISTDSVRLRFKSNPAVKGGGNDISAYTTAGGANLNLEGQVVPVLGVFTPFERA